MRDNVRLGKLIYLTRSQGPLRGPTSSILYIFHFFSEKDRKSDQQIKSKVSRVDIGKHLKSMIDQTVFHIKQFTFQVNA